MQLILPQSELEQAIKNYVNDLMNVKDGAELCIDLRAGRGVDGFTATVDIIKSGTAAPVKTVVPMATPLAAVVPANPSMAALKVPARTVVKESPEAVPVAVVVVEEVLVVEPQAPAVADKSEQQDAAVETKEEAAPEVTTTVRRPLFGSLKKPE